MDRKREYNSLWMKKVFFFCLCCFGFVFCEFSGGWFLDFVCLGFVNIFVLFCLLVVFFFPTCVWNIKQESFTSYQMNSTFHRATKENVCLCSDWKVSEKGKDRMKEEIGERKDFLSSFCLCLYQSSPNRRKSNYYISCCLQAWCLPMDVAALLPFQKFLRKLISSWQ